MNRDPENPRLSTGLLRVRDHCTFTWFRQAESEQRLVHVREDHCETCIAEVRRRGYDVIANPSDKEPD